MIVVTLVPYDIIMFVLYLRAYFVSSYQYRHLDFLQGRSFNPYFNRFILCYLIHLYMYKQQGAFSRFH